MNEQMIIVDECHHVSAESFERVLNLCTAFLSVIRSCCLTENESQLKRNRQTFCAPKNASAGHISPAGELDIRIIVQSTLPRMGSVLCSPFQRQKKRAEKRAAEQPPAGSCSDCIYPSAQNRGRRIPKRRIMKPATVYGVENMSV